MKPKVLITTATSVLILSMITSISYTIVKPNTDEETVALLGSGKIVTIEDQQSLVSQLPPKLTSMQNGEELRITHPEEVIRYAQFMGIKSETEDGYILESISLTYETNESPKDLNISN